jgi:hypothetical protein
MMSAVRLVPVLPAGPHPPGRPPHAVDRTLGKPDPYPFVFTGAVIAELGIVYDLITS